MAHRALVAHDRRAADRAVRRHLELALVARAPLDDRPDDLGDDVASLLEHDVVADADVLAAHLVQVVQRGPRHGRARPPSTGVMCATGVSVPVRPTYGDDVLDHASRPAPAGTCRRSPSAVRATTMPRRACWSIAIDLDHDAVRAVRAGRGAAPASAR